MINTCTNLTEVKKYEYNTYYDYRHKNKILKIIYLVESSRYSNIPKDMSILCQ